MKIFRFETKNEYGTNYILVEENYLTAVQKLFDHLSKTDPLITLNNIHLDFNIKEYYIDEIIETEFF